jgi:predicted metal-binding protein
VGQGFMAKHLYEPGGSFAAAAVLMPGSCKDCKCRGHAKTLHT